jgi:hypothetical protein
MTCSAARCGANPAGPTGECISLPFVPDPFFAERSGERIVAELRMPPGSGEPPDVDERGHLGIKEEPDESLARPGPVSDGEYQCPQHRSSAAHEPRHRDHGPYNTRADPEQRDRRDHAPGRHPSFDGGHIGPRRDGREHHPDGQDRE